MTQTYTEDQLRESALEFFNNDLLAANVWINKYALRIDNKYVELNPDDTVKRISKEIARAESKFPNPLSQDEIYQDLKDFKKFIFAGSILFGCGNPTNVTLGNCYFIDNESDSYGGIFNLDESIAQLMKRRAGVGVTLEHLRPKYASVKNSAHSSTGAVSFMNRFSNTTREVAQDGRRGALMISMHAHHPDITDFIGIKDDLTKVTGANVSVKMTDEFMNAAKSDQDFYLTWPIQKQQPSDPPQIPYNTVKLIDGTYIKKVKAREIWDSIIKMAHKNAEPGVLFWDNIVNESPADMYKEFGFVTQGTNPCGEVPLSSHDSCRLGSINVFGFIEKPFTDKARVNWTELTKMARKAQRFMDDIITLEEDKIAGILKKINEDPEAKDIKRPEIELWKKVRTVLRNGRRTGLGILGLGDALAALGITYGTKEATKMAEKIMKTIAIGSYRESVNMAKERGAFGVWNADVEAGNPFLMRVISKNFTHEEYEDYLKYGRRNIANLSIAPTGSLAIMTRTTSSMEPVFKCYFYRVRKVNANEEGVKVDFVDQSGDAWEEYYVMHPPFEKWCNDQGIDPHDLPQEELDALVEKSPWAGSEAHTIDYVEKVNMQGAIQKWVDHSISVTHNLPEDISVEAVNDIYFQAWKAGCKGCTIYREGSRTGVLSTTKKSEDSEDDFAESMAPKRPKVLPADYYSATAKGNKFAVVIGLYKDKPYEVFAFENPPRDKSTKGKIIKVKKGHYKFVNGEFEIDNLELAAERVEERSLTLTCSALLRHGVNIEFVNKTIRKVDENISSFSSVIRRYLSRYAENNGEANGEACPHCQEDLITESGCIRCVNPECGYEKCG